MNRKSGSGSGIFLMEMMMVVLFFMLCASICVLAFVKSENMSRLAAERNQAVLVAESVAEIWKLEGAEGLEARMHAREILVDREGTALQEGSSHIGWDADWQCVDGTGQVYHGWLQETREDNGLATLTIQIQKNGYLPDTLFELEVSRYEEV